MKVYITRRIPDAGIKKLQDKGYEVDISEKDGVLTREELVAAVSAKPYDAVLCLLTDKIDKDVFAAVPTAKIFANYAVGYDNLNLPDAKEASVTLTNTPGVLTEAVAEHAAALIMAIGRRIVESDKFMRAGKYMGWGPMMFLGAEMHGKTLGLVGLGRIGASVAQKMKNGFNMKVAYYDVTRNEAMEKELGLEYKDLNDLLKEADFISVHVPLLPTTKHLMSTEQFKMMKPTAYLINTSRGPIVDEAALVEALKNNVIRGAALDVYEAEPKMAPGLAELDNVVITPHIASATEETRAKMAEIAAENIIAFLSGQTPPNLIVK